jgi:pimeloyl-ACP methyl ester carboxylesterase
VRVGALAVSFALALGCASFALALGCAASGPAPPDPLAQDPVFDAAQPALSNEVVFESAGARMFGLVYEAPGTGPHPTVVVLHGFPGNERNLDLAQAIRRSGWNAVFFHYRGAWGSQGDFGFVHVLEDVAAVVATLRQPEFAARHRIDPTRIALVGHSMGGFAALVSAAELAGVDCAASLAGANLGLWAEAVATREGEARMAGALESWSGPIRGTSGAALVAEVSANAARFDVRRHAPALAQKPLLLVAGSRDDVTPPALHHDPLAAAVAAQPGARLEAVVLDADHAFADRRVALTRLVLDWLARDCGAPGAAP